MTICPQCGKEYRITPDVCGECGTPLTVSDIADPFAEAVREEEKLREQSRLRREARQNPPAPAETEPTGSTDGFDDADEPADAAAQPKHTGLRALAVTAALAVAAGGGWYGWKRLRKGKEEEPTPAGMDIRYFIGNQAYFYDGTTGRSIPLGEPSGRTPEEQAAFWEKVTVSEDHSRIFFPKRPFSEDYNDEVIYPYYIDLNGSDTTPKAVMPMTFTNEDSVTKLDCNVLDYALLDPAGCSMLLKPGSRVNDRITDPYDDTYAVWQDPAQHGGNSLALNETGFRAAYVIRGREGAFFAITENDASETANFSTTRINDETVIRSHSARGDGERYTLQMWDSREGSYVTLSTSVTDWTLANLNSLFSDDTEQPARYLFYTASMFTDDPDLPADPYLISRNGLSIEVKGGQYTAANDAAEQLSPQDLQRAGHEMMQSLQYEYGTELHRCDLVTGEDKVLYTDISAISSCWNYDGLPNGLALAVYFIEDHIVGYDDDTVYPMDGEFSRKGSIVLYGLSGGTDSMILPSGLDEIESMLPTDREGNRFLICLNDGSCYILDCLSTGPRLFTITFDESEEPAFLSRAATSSDGNWILLYSEYRQYLVNLTIDADLPDSLTTAMVPAVPIEADLSRDPAAVFCGSSVVSYQTAEDSAAGCCRMYVDDALVTDRADPAFQAADPNTGAIYFLEYIDPESRTGSLRTLCRYQNGEITRIADSIDKDSVCFDREKGSFAFVRFEAYMNDHSYAVYVGNADSAAMSDCTPVLYTRELPVLDV